MALSEKQRLFCEEYLIDLNGSAAAIRAGYSTKTARVIALELLSKPNVRAYIDIKLSERSKRTGINQDRIIWELAKIALVNPVDVINMDTAELTADYSREDTAVIASVKVKQIPTDAGMGIEREIRMADKIKALELLGKHFGMFVEKREITGRNGEALQIVFANMKPPAESDDNVEEDTGNGDE